MLMSRYYEDLEKESCATEIGAKRKAGHFDLGVWLLPSGGYIALEPGIKVPAGSELVAKRYNARDKWRPIHAAN